MSTFNFTVNGNIQNQQVVTNPQETVIQNNGTSSDDLLRIFEAIRVLVQSSSVEDSYSQELQQIVTETETALSEQGSQNIPQTITSFTEKVQAWLSAGQNMHDMAITAQTLFNSVSALL